MGHASPSAKDSYSHRRMDIRTKVVQGLLRGRMDIRTKHPPPSIPTSTNPRHQPTDASPIQYKAYSQVGLKEAIPNLDGRGFESPLQQDGYPVKRAATNTSSNKAGPIATEDALKQAGGGFQPPLPKETAFRLRERARGSGVSGGAVVVVVVVALTRRLPLQPTVNNRNLRSNST
ncbi:hypothetical protein ACFX2A_016520 [Malus domestica]